MASTILICLALLSLFGDSVIGGAIYRRAAKKYTGPGSDPKLKEKFMERCKNYNVNPNHKGLASANLPQDCPKLWDIFTKPFAFKDPCKPDSYEAFVTATSGPPMPANKALFWSRTPGIAQRWSGDGARMIVLADLLTGYLVKDNLVWCGSPSTPDGIDYANCPTREDCDTHGEFWRQASRMLAKRTQGVATVLLHGSKPGEPYWSTSFFAKEEMPNLNPKIVPTIKALIVRPVGKDLTNNADCNGQAMKTLAADIKATHGSQIKLECEVDPKEVQPYL